MVQDEALVELKTQEGKTYYWNRRDNSRSWALPDGVSVKWVGQKAQDGRTYYWSRGTKETVWVLPPLKSQSEEGQSGDTAKDGSAPPLPSEAGPELPREASASAPPLPASKGPELPKDAAAPSGSAPRLPSEAGPGLPKESSSSGAGAPPLPAAAGPELPKEATDTSGSVAQAEESSTRAEPAPAAAAPAEESKEKATKQAAEAEGGAQAGVVAAGLQGMLQSVPGMPMSMPLLLAAQMQPQPQPQLLGMMPGMLPGMLPGLPGMPMGMMPTGLPGMLPGLPGMPMGMSLQLAAQMAQSQPQAQALAQAQGVVPPHPPPGVLPPPGPPPGVLPPPGPPPGSAQAIAQDASKSRDAADEQGAAGKDEDQEEVEEEEEEAEADLSEPHIALPDEDVVAGPKGESASAVAARHLIEKSGCDSWFRRLPTGEWEEVVRFWPLPQGFAMPKLYLPRPRKGKRKADKYGLKKVLLRCQAHEEMVRALLMAQYRSDLGFSVKKFPSPKSSDWCFWTQEGRQFIVDALLAQDLPEDSSEGVRRAPPEGDRYRLLRPAVRSCLSSVFLSPMLRKLERATKSGDKAATKEVLDLLSKSEVPWKLSRDANKLVNPPQPKQEAASELPMKPLDPTSMPIPTKAKGGVFMPPPGLQEVPAPGRPMQSLPDGPPVFVKAASELPANIDPMSFAIPTKAKGGAFVPPPTAMNEAPSPGMPMQSQTDSPPVFSKGGFRPPAPAAGTSNNMAAPDVAAFPFKSKAPGPPPMLLGSAPAMDGGRSQGPMVFTKASAAGPMSTMPSAPPSAAGFQAPAQPMAPLYKQPPSEAQPIQSQLQPPGMQQPQLQPPPPQQQPQQQPLPPPPQQPPPLLQQPQPQQLQPPPQQQLLPPPPQQPPPLLQQQQGAQPSQQPPGSQQPPPTTQQPLQMEQGTQPPLLQQQPLQPQQQQPPPQQLEQPQQTPHPQPPQQPPQQQQPLQPQPQPQQEQAPQQKAVELQQQPAQQPTQSVQPPAFKAPPLQQFGAGPPAANPPATSSTASAFQVPPSTVANAATMGSEAAGEPDQAAPWAARKRRRTRGGDAAGSTPAQDASASAGDVNGGQQKEAPRSVADHAAADRIAAAAEKVAAATGQDVRIERLRRKVMVSNIAAPAKATELADFVTGAIFSATGHTLAAQWQSGEASKVVVEVDFSVSQAAGEASGGSVAEVTLAKATAASVAVALNGIQYRGKALEIKRPKGFIGEPLKRSQLQSISIKDLVGSEDAMASQADEPTRREGGAIVKGSTSSIAVVQLTGIPASMNERSVFDLLQQFGGPLRRLSLAGVGASGSHEGHGTAEYVEASSAAEAVRFSPLLGLIEVRIAAEAVGEAPAPKRQRRNRFGDAEAEDLGPFEAAFQPQSNPEGDAALDLGPFEAVLPPSKAADKADVDLGVFEAVLPPSDKQGGNDMVEDLGPFAAALQGL